MIYSKLRFNPLSMDSVLLRCCVSGGRGATGRPRHHRHHLWSRSAAGRASAAPPATPPPAEFHCRHPGMGGCVARRPQQPSRALLQVLTRVTGVGVPVVPTLLQHFSRAGLGRLQLNVRALPWAGWEEDGRKQDNSLFSGWIHPTFPSTHQDWGVAPLQNMCNIGPGTCRIAGAGARYPCSRCQR